MGDDLQADASAGLLPANGNGRIAVFARVRPLLEREVTDEIELCVTRDPSSSRKALVQYWEGGAAAGDKGGTAPEQKKEFSFEFDRVFGSDADQKEVYTRVGAPVLRDVLAGYNGTILAYGQTGAGKTFSLLNAGGTDPKTSGLVPRLVAALFVAVTSDAAHVYTIEASMVQIYNEQIDDLLAEDIQKGQNLKFGGGELLGQTWVPVKSAEEIMNVFSKGRGNLVYAETKMNKVSSRSHAVIQVKIQRRDRAAVITGNALAMKTTVGKLTVVDLAGSERVKRSGVTGKELQQAININQSLLCFGNVVAALVEKKKFVPYRDSKLTRLLEDSIGGNCKTNLLARAPWECHNVCVSPARDSVEESTMTLEFASRAMLVETNAVVNEMILNVDATKLAQDLKGEGLNDAMREKMQEIRDLQQQVVELKTRLAGQERRVEESGRQARESARHIEFFKKSALEEASRSKEVEDKFKEKEQKLVEQLALASEKASDSMKQQLRIAQRKGELLDAELEEQQLRVAEERRSAEEAHAAEVQQRDEKITELEEATKQHVEQLAELTGERATLVAELAQERRARVAEKAAASTALAETAAAAEAARSEAAAAATAAKATEAELRTTLEKERTRAATAAAEAEAQLKEAASVREALEIHQGSLLSELSKESAAAKANAKRAHDLQAEAAVREPRLEAAEKRVGLLEAEIVAEKAARASSDAAKDAEIKRLKEELAKTISDAAERQQDLQRRHDAVLEERAAAAAAALRRREEAATSSVAQAETEAKGKVMRINWAFCVARGLWEHRFDDLNAKYAELEARHNARESRVEDIRRIKELESEIELLNYELFSNRQEVQQLRMGLANIAENDLVFSKAGGAAAAAARAVANGARAGSAAQSLASSARPRLVSMPVGSAANAVAAAHMGAAGGTPLSPEKSSGSSMGMGFYPPQSPAALPPHAGNAGITSSPSFSFSGGASVGNANSGGAGANSNGIGGLAASQQQPPNGTRISANGVRPGTGTRLGAAGGAGAANGLAQMGSQGQAGSGVVAGLRSGSETSSGPRAPIEAASGGSGTGSASSEGGRSSGDSTKRPVTPQTSSAAAVGAASAAGAASVRASGAGTSVASAAAAAAAATAAALGVGVMRPASRQLNSGASARVQLFSAEQPPSSLAPPASPGQQQNGVPSKSSTAGALAVGENGAGWREARGGAAAGSGRGLRPASSSAALDLSALATPGPAQFGGGGFAAKPPSTPVAGGGGAGGTGGMEQDTSRLTAGATGGAVATSAQPPSGQGPGPGGARQQRRVTGTHAQLSAAAAAAAASAMRVASARPGNGQSSGGGRPPAGGPLAVPPINRAATMRVSDAGSTG